MSDLAIRISSELQALIGQPIADWWRAADMAVVEFGPRHRIVNRKGDAIDVSDLRLHLQCRWRFTDSSDILFGSDDLYRPADEGVSHDDFDWDKQDSVLDVKWRTWILRNRGREPRVIRCIGDAYGGFRIELEGGVILEAFPCNSRRGECSEHWRLIGHRIDGAHFVVTGYGIQGTHDAPHE
jgi:hypothetical protein